MPPRAYSYGSMYGGPARAPPPFIDGPGLPQPPPAPAIKLLPSDPLSDPRPAPPPGQNTPYAAALVVGEAFIAYLALRA